MIRGKKKNKTSIMQLEVSCRSVMVCSLLNSLYQIFPY